MVDTRKLTSEAVRDLQVAGYQLMQLEGLAVFLGANEGTVHAIGQQQWHQMSREQASGRISLLV